MGYAVIGKRDIVLVKAGSSDGARGIAGKRVDVFVPPEFVGKNIRLRIEEWEPVHKPVLAYRGNRGRPSTLEKLYMNSVPYPHTDVESDAQ